jgi:very-short-patch-repair endonuclease
MAESDSTVGRARRLRKHMSLPEVLFWKAVRKFQAGIKFRRQHPFGPYILDFYCLELKFAVEIDGAGHEFTVEHDARRDAYLNSRGVRVLRVPAKAILENLEGVLDLIVIEARRSSPGP